MCHNRFTVKKKSKPPKRRKPVPLTTLHEREPAKLPTKELSLFSLFLRSILLSLLITCIFLTITGMIVAGVLYRKSLQFTEPAQTSLTELIQTTYAGWHTIPQEDQGKVNFLILGSDELANRDSERPLTDTMIVASLNLKTAQISLFSLPRDIWVTSAKTKINALYADSMTANPNDPTKLPKQTIEELTGVPIQHTIIIKLNALSELVDIVGGVDVNVKESFTDPLFPRSDVDVTKVHDPRLLYETVSFASGSTHMSGADVLKYVRSRHSTGDQGSDNARGSRQQDVILALIEKFKDQHFWYDLHRDGLLYHFYVTNFGQYVSLTEAIAIGHQLLPQLQHLSFTEGTPTIYPDVTNGVIYHPTGNASMYYGAWVYEIKDPKLFKAEARKDLQY